MFNICQQPFVSYVNASLIHQDNCDIDNLFSLNLVKRRIGFQIERFVRPPLSIDVSFIIPIEIHYIVIWIGLYEHNERCKIEIIPSTTNDTSFPKRCYSSFLLTQSEALSLFHNPLLTHLDTTIPNKVLGSQMCDKLVCQQIISQPLKPINQLTTTTNLSICFKQFTSSRALSIKCLEVWGVPSKYCTADQLKCFEKAKETCCLGLQEKHEAFLSPGLYNTTDDYKASSSSSSSLTSECTINPATESGDNKVARLPYVPENFLDQLTFEIMTLPYCLPSGYYVDQSSIDKCKECDLLYGRPPTDPFTGLPYSKTSQPMFCAELKSQIDLFTSTVNEDCSATITLGRTLGSADDITKHRKSVIGN